MKRRYNSFPVCAALCSLAMVSTSSRPAFSQQFAGQSPRVQFQVTYSFKGGEGGFAPMGAIADNAGDLYGTTFDGGTGPCDGGRGCGIVFKLDSAGETVLHRFAGDARDQGNPLAGVIEDASGNLYGTTFGGGGSGDNGTVFKVEPGGKENVLHDFNVRDGLTPYAGVVSDGTGDLYGTTASGGTSGQGVVFKVDAKGRESVLYSFTGGADGGSPETGLIRDSSGKLYGMTLSGGASGQGTVFMVDTHGKETVLYSFSGGTDGGTPLQGDGLLRDSAGNLYGTTAGGGDLSCSVNGFPGCGVVFKLDNRNKETVLYAFKGQNDGSNPSTGVVRDKTGNLYGATQFGGGHFGCLGGQIDCGVVFKISNSGKLSVLHAFTGGADGGFPTSLVQDAAGALYGTAAVGGSCPDQGCGTVFRISVTGASTRIH